MTSRRVMRLTTCGPRTAAQRMLAVLVAASATWVAACGGSTPDTSAPEATPNLVREVRAANTAGDVARGAALVDAARASGVTPTVLLAQSWVGRGALAADDLETAERVGQQTHVEALELLGDRPLDDEPDLALALGASIELLANVAVAQGARSEALAYLERERDRHAGSPIEMRLQKNVNLLSLEGTPALPLTRDEYLGDAPPPSLDELRGQVVLVFFWAHWCSDCKAQVPVLAQLRERYGARGLTVLAPTRRYGYVAGGVDADPATELAYIGDVWRDAYDALSDVPVFLDLVNHERYGVSTTPTLLLVDRAGLIRHYHPGEMSDVELDPLVRALLDADAPAS